MVENKNSNKYTVLIVDDEFRIGQLIRHLIDWGHLPLKCLEVFTNPQEAREMIFKMKPNIVITDIRMPKISGLDIVRETRNLGLDTSFIVISGYKEFEYAQQALQYGVVDYLLKPIKQDELNHALNSIVTRINKKQSLTNETIELRDELEQGRRRYLNSVLKNIALSPDTVRDDTLRIFENLGCKHRVIDFKLDLIVFDEDDIYQTNLISDKLYYLIQTVMKEDTVELVFTPVKHLHHYLLLTYQDGKQAILKDKVQHALNMIREYLLGLDRYVISAGVGMEVDDPRGIPMSLQSSNKAVAERILFGSRKILREPEFNVKRERSISAEQEWSMLQRDYISSVEILSKIQTIQSVGQAFKIMKKHQFSGQDYYSLALQWSNLFFNTLEYSEQIKKAKIEMITAAIENSRTVKELEHVLCKSLSQFLDDYISRIENEASRPVREAIDYIEQHFSDKLCLEKLAAIVDLNPTYFSTLFKQEMGTNFSSYLLDKRIEKAKCLLIEGNETISSIAEQVGYLDSRYFSKIFTKEVGVKPSLYRKIHR